MVNITVFIWYGTFRDICWSTRFYHCSYVKRFSTFYCFTVPIVISRFITLSYTSFQVSLGLFMHSNVLNSVKLRQCCNDKFLKRSCVLLFIYLMKFLSFIKFFNFEPQVIIKCIALDFSKMFLTEADLKLLVELKMLKLNWNLYPTVPTHTQKKMLKLELKVL